MISTRGRYALRIMIDLAERQDEGYIPMKDVAKRQGVSLGYMEKILPVWTELDRRINEYLDSVTVADLLKPGVTVPC